MALYAASLGTTALAAYQVLINLYTLFGLFGEPLSQAAQAMLPPLLEQKDRRGVRRAVKMLGGKNSPPQSLSTPAAFGKNKSLLTLGLVFGLGAGSLAALAAWLGGRLFSEPRPSIEAVADPDVLRLLQHLSPVLLITVASLAPRNTELTQQTGKPLGHKVFEYPVDGAMLATKATKSRHAREVGQFRLCGAWGPDHHLVQRSFHEDGMNDGGKVSGKAVPKVVTFSHGAEYLQFVLQPGNALLLGRGADCDVVVASRGVSGHHAVLRYRPPDKPEAEAAMCLEDTSTNGTGVSAGTEWQVVRKGNHHVINRYAQILLPYNCKEPREAAVLTFVNHGEGLPEAYDSKAKTGRWIYKGKLGEGGLGVVHRATDTWGKLKGDIAIKVCKLAKDVKVTGKLRSAFILHREAQWSLQRIHNTKQKDYSQQKASYFARYLEDHTGRWSRDCDFDKERSIFESADFRWDKFKPQEMMPAYPYVAMEYVPGRTLHSALGWQRDQPLEESYLSQEEKEAILLQAAEALTYLYEMNLIHRDFRTTNLMVSHRKPSIQVKVIDLGHTILAQEHQCKNKSAVVRCNWKEEEKKRFDWAPPEVKAKEPFVNFSYPLHSFDVFSFGVLAVQLQTTSMQSARLAVNRLMGLEKGEKIGGKLGFSQGMLERMVGDAANRASAQTRLDTPS
ncbi:Probable serine/threonine-protein kinase PknB [Durusdinium trenchii]|uniref:Probable serine/threonine-protein kinase PknB n=1 Tax=Durusdinium trenchii TaxID=1381693 RepID=A0ABP0RCT6_9DINO